MREKIAIKIKRCPHCNKQIRVIAGRDCDDGYDLDSLNSFVEVKK
jgi:uncharacterized protein with PIN domain